jgi:hypothetical protein
MDVEELLKFICSNIKTFASPTLIKNGVAYHYTNHYDKIIDSDGFLGAPIDENLDKTQITIPSKPATHSPGVVFAYLDEAESRREGFGCDIIMIKFKEAISATHAQEASLGQVPNTILILNTDIQCFEKL